MDEELLNSVENLNFFDTEDTRHKKLSVIQSLERISEQWVRQLACDQGLHHRLKDKEKLCRVLVQGSLAIGVGSKCGDVDAVLLVPNFVDRDDFFTSFTDQLRKIEEITDLVAVPDTFVPLIRMKLSGIPVDLVISRLGTSYIPTHLDFEQPPGDLYHNMDIISVRSLSGLHLAHELKKTMSDYPIILPLMRIIRAWYKARSIGSYVYGFPSSVAWALMVVYTCKRAEDKAQASIFCQCKRLTECRGQNLQEQSDSHSLSCLVYTFFAQFSSWPWPHPVQISSIKFASDLNIFSWDPQRNAQDGRDLMPIITPVFPNKNAAFSVRPATRKIVTDELSRGCQIVADILEGTEQWEKLFQPYDIRNHYRHFLLLTLKATSNEERVVVGGLIDSRMRDLAQTLEDEQCIHSTRIAPLSNRQGDNSSNASRMSLRRQWLLGMDIEPGTLLPDGTRSRRNVDITGCLSTFYQILRERDPFTDFGEKLTHAYLNRSQVMQLTL